MGRTITHLALGRGLPTLLVVTLLAGTTSGQVVQDGSLPGTQAGPVLPGFDPEGHHADYLIRGDLGLQLGSNLFYSFSDFSIPEGKTATFTDQGLDAASIENVVSRVTGGDVSRIDGTLRSTLPSADVWLLNPEGVVFGERARLDVRSGFHAAAAEQLDFSDGSIFGAGADGDVPMLEAAHPLAFGLLAAGEIRLEGGYLAVADEAALSLATAGSLEIEAGSLVEASGGRIELTGSEVVVAGEVSAIGLKAAGGAIVVTGEVVRVEEGGLVTADALEAPFRSEPASIELRASQLVRVDGEVSAASFGGAAEGSVALIADEIQVGTRGVVTAHTDDPEGRSGFSRSGSVSLAGRTIAVEGFVSAAGVNADGGPIALTGESVRLAPSGTLSALSLGGVDGTVRVEAAERDLAGRIDGSLEEVDPGPAALAALDAQLATTRWEWSPVGDAAGLPSGPGDAPFATPEDPAGGPALILAEDWGITLYDRFGEPVPLLPGLDPEGQFADILIPADAGEQRGKNLFHRFAEFSIAPETTVTFTPEGSTGPIDHVIARVTGGPTSRIDGKLRSTIDGSSLWLLNPAGLLFGPGATLDLPGSFFGTSADNLASRRGPLFGPAGELSAEAPQGFLFEAGLAAAIQVDAFDLAVEPGSMLALGAAGDLSVSSGAGLRAPGGRLGLLGANVGIDGDASVSSDTGPAGSLWIRGDDVRVGGSLSADARAGGGQIQIEALGRLALDGEVSASGERGGRGGLVRLRAGSIRMGREARLLAISEFSDGGRLWLDAASDLVLDGLLSTGTDEGEGGRVALRGKRVVVGEDARIPVAGHPDTCDEICNADDGSMWIRATQEARILGEINFTGFENAGGPLLVEAPAISTGQNSLLRVGSGTALLRGSEVELGGRIASTASSRSGGIAIRGDAVVLEPAAILNSGSDDGGAGAVSLRGRSLEVAGRIDLSTTAEGSGGSVSLRAIGEGGQLSVSGTVTTALGEDSFGDAGAIRLDAEQVEVSGEVNASTQGADRSGAMGGEILVYARDLSMQGGRLRTESLRDSPAGRIGIDVRNATIKGGSSISSSAESGDAGDVSIDFANRFELFSSEITTRSESGGGGNILINGAGIEVVGGDLVARKDEGQASGFLAHLVDSTISAAVGGSGDGGDVLIDPEFLILDHSTILASAVAGSGGNILLVADTIFASPPLSEQLNASSQQGADGTVVVASPENTLRHVIDRLPESFLVGVELPTPCRARRTGQSLGSFQAVGRDGLPPGPDVLLPAWPPLPGDAAAAWHSLPQTIALLASPEGCAMPDDPTAPARSDRDTVRSR